jgi:hypothetical protein
MVIQIPAGADCDCKMLEIGGATQMPKQKARIGPLEHDTMEAAIERRAHDPARVFTPSDGAFAVILTLLVLEIKVPAFGEGQSLVHAMRDIRPSFVAFVISFVVIAIAWYEHRNLCRNIRSTDGPLLWLSRGNCRSDRVKQLNHLGYALSDDHQAVRETS